MKRAVDRGEYRKLLNRLERLSKRAHHATCGRCRLVSFLALVDGSPEFLVEAAELLEAHVEPGRAPVCDLGGCVHHERLPIAVARRMLRIAGRRIDVEDRRGRRVGSVDFDAEDREDGGELFLRFTRRHATAHVWASPPVDAGGGRSLLRGLAEGWDRGFEATRDYCFGRYRELRALAEMDLDLDPAKPRERRAPQGRRR